MSSFKEFLEKKGNRSFNPKTNKTGKVVSVQIKALGEWAWSIFAEKRQMIKLHRTFAKKKGNDLIEHFIHESEYVYASSSYYWVHFQIAVYCLGESVVRQRLEGLK